MTHPLFCNPELYAAVCAWPRTEIPLTEDMHFFTIMYGGPVNTRHFYLENEVLIFQDGRKRLIEADWARLCHFIKEENYGDLSYYSPYYEVKEIYEDFVKYGEENTQFRTKYKKKTDKELFEEALEYDKWIAGDPSTNPEIQKAENAHRFTAAHDKALKEAYKKYEEKLSERDPIILDNWKEKATRYRMTLYQRSLQRFIENPEGMLRVWWHLAITAYEKKEAEYKAKNPNVQPRTLQRKLTKFRKELKLPLVTLFNDARHAEQYITTGIFSYKYRIFPPPMSRTLTRKEFKQYRSKQEELESKRQTAKALNWELDELEQLCEKEEERKEEKDKKR